jgi:hypothetical protein
MKAAHIYFPEAFRDLKETGSVGERLGGTTSTIYYCGYYTAPLHCDDDVSPGLCAQTDLHADSSHHEFAFINLAYNCYFVGRPNSFWSGLSFSALISFLIPPYRTFRGSDPHGTMLPSEEPLQMAAGAPGEEGHTNPRISNGLHKTKPRRNAQAAERYANVRQTKQAVEKFWGV